MIDRDETNSRMKDYFDVYQIFKAGQVDEEVLADAIRNTFRNRETGYHEGVHVFMREFATDEMRVKRWKKFLKDIKFAEELPFDEVMACLKEKLEKYWSEDFLNE